MNSKQRVHAALRREPVDRVPIFMWFHPDTISILARLLEVPRHCVDLAMGNDVRMTWVNNNYAMEGITHERDGEGHLDFWGIQWVKKGPYNQIARFPMAQAPVEEVRDYRFPSGHLETLLSLMNPLMESADEYFIGCDISPCIFEMYWRLRGMEQAMLDLVSEPDLTDEMFGRCADFAAVLGEEACRRFPLEMFWTGDDVAGQRSLLMSPETWRARVKPHLRNLFDVGKRHGLWIAYHCCGALRPIIPDLIEMGMDILNPVQCNCPGMEPLELKREYGRHLNFMGGIDTQGVLPHGKAAEVRRATRRLIDGMTAGGGGYILAASHTIPPETPVENIFAMYEEAGLSREEIYDKAARVRAGQSPFLAGTLKNAEQIQLPGGSVAEDGVNGR